MTVASRFGGTAADALMSVTPGGQYIKPPAGRSVTLWTGDASTSGRTQYTDLRLATDPNTSVTSIPEDSQGNLPEFDVMTSATITRAWASPDGGATGRWITVSGDLTGVFARSDHAGALNRQPPSMSFTRIGSVVTMSAPWKDTKVGMGMDVVWDPDTRKYAMLYTGQQTGGTSKFGIAYSTDGDTWTDYALAAPVVTLGTAGTSGGTFAAGTYYWKVTAKDPIGESVGSNEVTATLAASGTQPLSWPAVSGAKSYNVYRGTAAGSENVLVANVTTASYTDTGAAGTAGSVPTTSTAVNPIFGPNPTAGQWDSGGVTFPQLIRYQNKWMMFYIGFPNAGFEQGTPNVGYATATSLLGPWTRGPAVLTPSNFPSGTTVIYRPRVIKVGATWYMFINAGPAAGSEDIYYATASSPTGPWTVGPKIIDHTSFTGSTLASDPEVVRFGDWWLLICWAANGVSMAYTDDAAFPGGWTAIADPVIPGSSPNLMRPVWYETPYGPRLVLNPGNSTIDLYVPFNARTRMSQVATVVGAGQGRIENLIDALKQMGLRALPEALVADAFNRPDGAIGTTEVGGYTWATGGGTGWAISGQKAAWTGTTDGSMVINSGLADNYAVAFVVQQVNGNYPVGIVARGSSATSYVKVYRNYQNWTLNDGTGHDVYAPTPLAVGDKLRVEVSGTTYKLYRNDALEATWTGITAHNTASDTYQGVLGSANLATKVDRFSISSLT